MPQEAATTDLERRLAQALRELSEARDQQAATSDVLRIIQARRANSTRYSKQYSRMQRAYAKPNSQTYSFAKGMRSASLQCTTPPLPMRRSDCANHCVTD